MTSPRERIEMRVDSEIKNMAERAATASGCASLTEFMVRLIRENAPQILLEATAIELSNRQFDNFMTICHDDSLTPSKRILAAAKRLDDEGF